VKKLQDITGLKFGRWTVLQFAGYRTYNSQRYPFWKCRCECGTIAVVGGANLRKGHSKSCGCLRQDIARKLISEICFKHGHARRHKHSAEYDTWNGIIKRCTRPYESGWKNYGARGITVCARWRNDFEAFLADMGPHPGRGWSIERINNDGNYEPANCIWGTIAAQSRNRRTAKLNWFTSMVIAFRKLSGEPSKHIALDLKEA
jgi:hypothetical protein